MADPIETRLAEIEARRNATTGGEWTAEKDAIGHGVFVGSRCICRVKDDWSEKGKANMAFITRAHNDDIQWLVSQVWSLRQFVSNHCRTASDVLGGASNRRRRRLIKAFDAAVEQYSDLLQKLADS